MDSPDRKPIPSSEDADVIRSKAEFPPATYIFKVQSFSQLSSILQKTKKDKLESRVFECSGHKWKLVLYPNGDTKRNVKDHISLYLAMAEENAIPDGFALLVRFEFFIHDQNQDNYLTIKNNKVMHYHNSKKEHGFHKLLPLRIFNDSSNGYLVDDTCAFGVEVNVVNFSCRGDKIYLINKPLDGTYTWKIKDFSTLKQHECLYSEVFTVAGHKWKVIMYPRGHGSAKGKYISLALRYVADENPKPDVYVEYNLMVKDQINGCHDKIKDEDWCLVESVFNRFMALTDLKDSSKGFLVNDTLIVEVEIIRFSAIEAC